MDAIAPRDSTTLGTVKRRQKNRDARMVEGKGNLYKNNNVIKSRRYRRAGNKIKSVSNRCAMLE